MPEATNQPAGAEAGKPATGIESNAANAQAGQGSESNEDRLAIRQRAIEAERKVAKLEATIKAAEDKKLADQGDYQKLLSQRDAELTEVRSKYRTERINNALFAAVYKFGVRDTSDLQLVKLTGDLDVDDSDALTAAAFAAVESLSKTKPYLFGTEAGDKPNAAKTKPAPPNGGIKIDPSRVTRDDVSKMTTEERKAYLEAVGNTPAGRPTNSFFGSFGR